LLLGMGFQTLLIAVVADLLAANRKLLEDVRFRLRAGSEADAVPIQVLHDDVQSSAVARKAY